MIKIYDTMTRSLREFVPIEEGKVRMYVCGPTVYNYTGIKPSLTSWSIRIFPDLVQVLRS